MSTDSSTYTAFVTGDLDFVCGRRVGPDWHTMFDDIARTMREMHAGRLVLDLRRLVPSTLSVVHVHVTTVDINIERKTNG